MNREHLHRGVISGLIFIVCAASNSLGDTLKVPADFPTIQAAIDASVDGDIVLVADGVYTGDGNRDMDFGGRAITVQSENGAEHCVIDIQASDADRHRAFTFHSFERSDSVLQGFTIKNGFMVVGGAVWCEFSTPLFQSCVFQHNAGGAVVTWHADATFIGCQFLENHAAFGGGAVALGSGCEAANGSCSRAEFYGCLFSGNTGSSAGGAVVVGQVASAEFVNCMFVGNQAVQGGAIWVAAFHGVATVVNCTFVGNRADEGGALWHILHRPFEGSTVDNSILWDESPEEIVGVVSVRFSDVKGGWKGEGNIDADPLFVDPLGGDYSIGAGSPAIDAADNTAVPEGVLRDLAGNDRFVDDPDTVDTGIPGGAGGDDIVDMGAYEYQVACAADLDGDGDTDADDFFAYLDAFSADKLDICDIDGDGDCDADDFFGYLDLFAQGC